MAWMRGVFLAVLGIHAVVHFMGAAKGFGWAELPQLTQPVSRLAGAAWLAAGLTLLAAGAMFLAVPRWWWVMGSVGVALSQVMVVSAWTDAKFGTVANVLVLLASIHGFASQGPVSLRGRYERETQARLQRHSSVETPMVTDADLLGLPEPVGCYLRRSGVVGQPRAKNFRAVWKGRIRGKPDDAWMEFTAEQHNFLTDDTRLFFMDARRAGMPVDVFHRFADGQASMKVRLASLLPLVDVSGPEPTRAETVTLLNDMSVLAPSSLLRDDLTWTPIDERSAQVAFTEGTHTVHAVLKFDHDCDLVDFVSDDRSVLESDGKTFSPQRWSTPLRDHRSFGPLRVAGGGEGRWHPPEGDYVYLEMDLVELQSNVVPD